MPTLGSGRYLSLLSVRPVAPLSFPPPSRAGCGTSPPGLSCAFPLRAGEGSGTTSKPGAGTAAGRGPRGAGPGGLCGEGRLPAPSGPPAGSSPGPAPRERALAAARRFPGRLKFEKVPVAGGAVRSNGGGDPAGERRAEGSEGRQHGGRGEPRLRRAGPWVAPSALRGPLHPPAGKAQPPAPPVAPGPGEGAGSGGGSGASRCLLRLPRRPRPGEVGEAVGSRWDPFKMSSSRLREMGFGPSWCPLRKSPLGIEGV